MHIPLRCARTPVKNSVDYERGICGNHTMHAVMDTTARCVLPQRIGHGHAVSPAAADRLAAVKTPPAKQAKMDTDMCAHANN
jgi:hypothetical protein